MRSARCMLLTFFALLVSTRDLAAQEAIVKIYAVGAAASGQGTGFLLGQKGLVVTAYHVVEGARKIEIVHDRIGSFANVIVAGISPEYDLAVLMIANAPPDLPGLKLAQDEAPRLNYKYASDGYARGGDLQHFEPRSTRAGFANSNTYRDERGIRLFAREIDVVALDFSAYYGMSGAPVVGPAGVIGVLSGSYAEGGGLAWAIPIKDLRHIQEVGRKPSEMSGWPSQSLMMAGAWRSQRTAVRVNVGAEAVFQAFTDQVETLATCYADLHEHSAAALPKIVVLGPFLDRVIADPSLRQTADAARKVLEPAEGDAAEELRLAVGLISRCGEEKRRVQAAAVRLMAWLVDESNVSSSIGERLVRQVRVLRDNYADINQVDLAEYLKLDLSELEKLLPRIAQDANAMPATRAAAMQAWLRALAPMLESFASVQAMLYTTREISKFRQMSRIFEPIVYSPDLAK